MQKNIGNVDFLGPVIVPWWLDKMLRAIAKLTRILFKTRYYTPNNLYLNLYGARYLRRKMKGKKYDLICAPASSAVLAYFKSDIPLIQVHDATFKLLLETYKEFESISMFSRWETFHLEQKALKKGVLSIYSSQWARQSAITDYHISPEKILVLPLGANMPLARDSVKYPARM